MAVGKPYSILCGLLVNSSRIDNTEVLSAYTISNNVHKVNRLSTYLGIGGEEVDDFKYEFINHSLVWRGLAFVPLTLPNCALSKEKVNFLFLRSLVRANPTGSQYIQSNKAKDSF